MLHLTPCRSCTLIRFLIFGKLQRGKCTHCTKWLSHSTLQNEKYAWQTMNKKEQSSALLQGSQESAHTREAQALAVFSVSFLLQQLNCFTNTMKLWSISNTVLSEIFLAMKMGYIKNSTYTKPLRNLLSIEEVSTTPVLRNNILNKDPLFTQDARGRNWSDSSRH